MKANDITRGTFKNNYLKQIVMRLDFQGVLQSEMEDVLLLVKKYLKQASFNRYEEKIGNEIELNVGLNSFNAQDPIKEVRQTRIYSFYNEDMGYSFDLSTNFIILKVIVAKYASFEEYSKLFIDICNIYKEKIDFFTTKRFGLRKINFCFVKDIKAVSKYFESKYYNYFELFDDTEIKTSAKTFNVGLGKKSLNVLYGVEQGKLGNSPVYKVTLDSDIYSEDTQTIDEFMFDKKDVCEMNEQLFWLYIDSITSEMGNILKNDYCDIPDDLLGVDSNE